MGPARRARGLPGPAQSAIMRAVTPYRTGLLALALSAALSSAAVSRAALWVSPAGDDANPGTEEQPLRTIGRARDVVRTMNAAMTDDITVFISGIHTLARPIEFGAGDSGTNGFSIVYTAAPGEHPVVSGALRVSGWSRADAARGLWSAPAPDGLDDSHDLFVNGAPARRTRARLVQPLAVGPAAPAADPKSQWRNPVDVVLLPPEAGALWSERTGPAPAFVENAFELLGRPGEWYFDRPLHRIYYTPRPGEDLASADVEAAVAEALISGQGSSDRPLTGLVFKGIRFEYTTRPAAGGTGAAAVRFTFAGSVQFLEDEFVHLATAALDLGPSFDGGTIEGCVFGDVALTAVRIDGASRVSVSQSRFSYVATARHDGAALSLGHSRDIVVEHNQIDHFPGAPILMEGGASTGSVAMNRIAAPLIGPEGDPPGPQPEGAGVSEPYRALLDETLCPTSAPEPPTGVSAEPEEGFAYVTWDPPCRDGGSTVVSYTVSSSSGASLVVPADAFRAKGYAVFGGLDTRASVAFTVSASNRLGSSVPSLASAPVVAAHKRRLKPPQAPTALSVVLGGNGARIQLTPPAVNGGSPVVAYSVTELPSGRRILLEGRDIVRSEPARALVRTVAGFAPAPGAVLSVAAVNAKGEGAPAQARVMP